MRPLALSFMFGIVAVTTTGALPATQTAPAKKPAFEVISVKLHTGPGRNASVADQPGGRFVGSQIPLRQLIRLAYRGNQDFIGGPEWIDTDRWDIEAKAAEGAPLQRARILDMAAPDTTALMVQSLLEERFKLKTHTEMRELPLYELTIAKGGSKLKLSEDQTPPPALVGGGGGPGGAALPRGGIRVGGAYIEGRAQSLSILALALATRNVGRPVVDKTGLKGLYDIILQWNQDSGLRADVGGTPEAPSGPSVFTAIEEQLGLKLESSKGPLPVLVIDSVERPSEN